MQLPTSGEVLLPEPVAQEGVGTPEVPNADVGAPVDEAKQRELRFRELRRGHPANPRHVLVREGLVAPDLLREGDGGEKEPVRGAVAEGDGGPRLLDERERGDELSGLDVTKRHKALREIAIERRPDAAARLEYRRVCTCRRAVDRDSRHRCKRADHRFNIDEDGLANDVFLRSGGRLRGEGGALRAVRG